MKSGALVWPVVIAALIVAALASLLAGHVWLSPSKLLSGDEMSRLIIWELRAPRAVLAILVGAALGLSGAVLQGLLRNPLAEPGLLGVSGGASLGAVVAIYFGVSTSFALATPLMGMAFALAAGALTFVVGRGAGAVALILAGAAVSALVNSGVALALNFAPSPYAAYEITTWLLGSLSNRSWDHVLLAAPFIAAGATLLALTGRALDALSLGEAQARSLGVHLGRTNLFALLGTALAVGAATSVTGAVGFIGLVAPHLVRPFVGHQPSRILAPSALIGAALLLATDVATRLIPSGLELRLSVLTSVIGLPFFFWLVLRMKRNSP
jgi:iron complex transport system permease protein